MDLSEGPIGGPPLQPHLPAAAVLSADAERGKLAGESLGADAPESGSSGGAPNGGGGEEATKPLQPPDDRSEARERSPYRGASAEPPARQPSPSFCHVPARKVKKDEVVDHTSSARACSSTAGSEHSDSSKKSASNYAEVASQLQETLAGLRTDAPTP